MRTSFFRYEDIGKELRRYIDWRSIVQVDDELVDYASNYQGIAKSPQYEFDEDRCADVFVVFPIIDYWNQYLGVMYLHAFLKSRGVSCTFVKGTLDDIKSVLKRNSTNLICYSCCATNFLSYYQLHVDLLNSIGEDLSVRSVYGGPHATSYSRCDRIHPK
ncbi:MAG: hypothetical protein COA36_17620 [Desulfotalea sp.]|nr:MAG: hypothetical protein COA36_17620 [Desulfotalea sp.]